LRQGFTGAQLLLFGAIMSPDGASAARDYDVVVVLEGPARQMVLREKQKVAGMWVNAEYTTLRSVPSFYAVVANRPIREITDPRTAAIYQLGLDLLQLSPSDSIDPARETHFAKGLVDLMQRQGLFHQDDHGVTINGQVLYSARINLPSSLQPGTYTAETFAVRKGRVVASATARVEVGKEGFEKAVADFSQRIAGLRAAGGGCLGGDGMDGRAPVCLDLKKAKLSLILTYCPHFRSTMTGVRISTKARLA
jgi:uncharacterized protein (TIGR02186 family)